MEKYQKVRVLGKGSFGSAILIKRKVDNALFVVKEVSLLKMSKKERDEARHECTILQKLKHPNIVRYVEQFENQKSLYIVMEYCDGGDLNGKIHQSPGPMKESTVMHYFSQVCLAMEYLHSFHMLHRDIKTMNVFLMKNGAVKLGDFGITTILRNTMGMANTVCGTPYYFSPELCRNKPYNNKSDIWALGVLLYECASGGRHPFDGANMNQLMQRIVTGQCPAISSQYSSEFRKMIAWCLQKDPIRRPSIKQLLSLPLVRRSLEQLEENLMLATECRVRLKDIIDFDVGSPNSEKSNECQGAKKTPCPSPRVDQKKAKQTPDLTPGQAAAMAVVQQSPRKSLPEPKPVSDVLGPKPRAVNAKNIQNNVNHATPSEPYMRNILDDLQQMRNRMNLAARAGVSPYAKRPASPNIRKIAPLDFEPVEKSGEIAPVRDSLAFCGYQPNVQRIKAIMAKYEHNANPQAKETIHAYMRRKQEEYFKKQREDLERRKRLNELREKELQRILVLQRRAALGAENNIYANGYNAHNNPLKETPPPAPLSREAVLSPRNNRAVIAALPPSPSSPSNKELRCASAQHSPAKAGGLPPRTPAQGLKRGLGVDPKYVFHSPVKDVSKGNIPFLMAQQVKLKAAAKSPLCVGKDAYQKAKPAVVKRREGPPLSGGPNVFPNKRYSNAYAFDRLDYKVREVVNRETEERKYFQQRSSFPINSGALHRDKNLVDKAAAPQGMVDDGMVITGTPVPQARPPQIRQARPPRPALLNALQDNGKGAESAVPKVTPPSTPSSNHNAEKRIRSSLNIEYQPHVATSAMGLRNRVPSSPALTPRGLAALPPAVLHSADDAAGGGAGRLFTHGISAGPNPDSPSIQAPNLPLTLSRQHPLVAVSQPSNQLVNDSNAALVKPLEKDNTNPQDQNTSALLSVQMNSPSLEVSSLGIKCSEDSLSEAELIDVSHTVKGCTLSQERPLKNMKKKICMLDSNSSDSTVRSMKAPLNDVKPIFYPISESRPHHLCWPLSGEAARYAGMLKGPEIAATGIELHLLKDVSEEGKEREVVLPSMLENLRTLRSKVSPRRDCTTVDRLTKQLALLKQRQRLGVDRHQLNNKNIDIVEANSQSDEQALGPILRNHLLLDTPRKKPTQNIEDIPRSRCASAESMTPPVSHHSDRDSEIETRRTSLVEGYEEMLQHLRSLLEKRRVSYRNIRKSYDNTNSSVSRSTSPANVSVECLNNFVSSNEIACPSLDPVSGSPPRLLNTKPGRNAKCPLLADMDTLSESTHTYEETEDLNGDDDNFEEAIPLSPVRCAVRNDMYTQMIQQNLVQSTEVDAKSSNVRDILHSNGAVHGQDGILRRDRARC